MLGLFYQHKINNKCLLCSLVMCLSLSDGALFPDMSNKCVEYCYLFQIKIMATAMKIRPTQNYPLKSFQADVMQFVQTEVFLCLYWILASALFLGGGGNFVVHVFTVNCTKFFNPSLNWNYSLVIVDLCQPVKVVIYSHFCPV